MISIGAIVAVVSLALCIIALHVWSFRRVSSLGKWQYPLILSGLVMATLFVPIADGSGHLATIRICTAYQVLAFPEFYLTNSRDLCIDAIVFLVTLLHNLACVFLASITVRRFRSEKSPNSANAG